jgi:WD40 repeat protein
MTGSRESFTVRILVSGTASPAGTGFLVDGTHILTCAHVVNVALGRDPRAKDSPGPQARIQIDFPMLGGAAGSPSRTCTLEAWSAPPATGFSGGDVAGLTIPGDDLPHGAGAARLAEPPASGLTAMAFGFPADPSRQLNGTWSELRLRGLVGGGVLQLDTASESAIRAQAGYSGSPVVVTDGVGDVVLGMLAAASGGTARDAYAIPLAELARCWPEVLGRLAVPPCPYRGLGAFTADDADVFTGRDDEVARLAAMARRQPLVIVTGSSGVGKSSLVNAGLVPLLRKRGWASGVFRPGGSPLDALAGALVAVQAPGRRLEVPEVRDWAAMLRADGLARLGSQLAVTLGQPVLLHVDQLEEVLDSAACPPDLSAEFLELLLAAAAPADGGLHLAASLRADFWPQLLEHPDAGTRLAGRWFGLSPMSRSRLEQVITQPAGARDVSYQDGLVRVIAEDAGGGRGLPLLEFTLTQLWPHQRDRQLTLAAYQGIGGVAGALSRHAEQAYHELLDQFAAERIRRVMLALVRSRGGAAAATRRPASRQRLGEDWPVAQALTGQRLVTIGGDPDKGEETAEVTHEALIREWPRFAAWVDDDADFQRWLALAEERAADGDLLPDTRLAEADRWRTERAGDVPAEVGRLIEDSKSAYARRVAELEEARARAERAARQAEARRLAAVVDVVLAAPGAPLQVLLALAVEALRLADVPEADRAVRRVLRLTAREITAVDCDGIVQAVTSGPGGTRLAVSHGDGITVLDVDGGATTVRFAVQFPEMTAASSPMSGTAASFSPFSVKAAAFSRDGTRIAVGTGGLPGAGTARVFDVATGIEVARFDHEQPVQSVTLSLDGAVLAIGGGGVLGGDEAVRIFDLNTAWEVDRLAHEADVAAVAFNPEGTLLATGSGGLVQGTVSVFGAVSWVPSAHRLQHDSQVNTVAFSPDGTLLATGSSHSAQIFGSPQGDLVIRLDHAEPVTALAFSPDGARIATVSGDSRRGHVARVFDTATGLETARLDSDHPLYAVAFTTDGNRTIAGSATKAWFFDATSGEEAARLGFDHGVARVTLSRDGVRVALANGGVTSIVDTATGARAARLDVGGYIRDLAFSPDGTRLGVTSSTSMQAFDAPSSTLVADAATGAEQARFHHDSPVTALAFSPDGTRVSLGGSGGAGGILRGGAITQVVDIASGAEIARLNHPSQATALAFSPDGTRIALGDFHRTAQVFNAVTGAEIARIQHDQPVYAIAFSPDGTRLATGSGDIAGNGDARIFDAATGAETARLDYGELVHAVAFSPDGSRVATGSRRGARVFDAATGTETAHVGHERPVTAVAFSPEGARLVTGDGTDGVRAWWIGRDRLIEQALSRLIRNLTEQEWRRYFNGEPYRKTRPDLPPSADA